MSIPYFFKNTFVKSMRMLILPYVVLPWIDTKLCITDIVNTMYSEHWVFIGRYVCSCSKVMQYLKKISQLTELSHNKPIKAILDVQNAKSF